MIKEEFYKELLDNELKSTKEERKRTNEYIRGLHRLINGYMELLKTPKRSNEYKEGYYSGYSTALEEIKRLSTTMNEKKFTLTHNKLLSKLYKKVRIVLKGN